MMSRKVFSCPFTIIKVSDSQPPKGLHSVQRWEKEMKIIGSPQINTSKSASELSPGPAMKDDFPLT